MGNLVVLVPAGGRGERFGSSEPKQLLAIGGRPVLAWTLERLCGLAPASVTVALPSGRELSFAGLEAFRERIRRVDGGPSRQLSVLACLAAAPGPEDDLILVHDGARPATSWEDLRAVVDVAQQTGAAVLGRPMSDTVKRLDGDRIIDTVDRRQLFRAETPQVFRRDLLARALAAAVREGRDETDESAAVEKLGDISIRAVLARHENPKLTVPSDVERVAALLGFSMDQAAAPFGPTQRTE